MECRRPSLTERVRERQEAYKKKISSVKANLRREFEVPLDGLQPLVDEIEDNLLEQVTDKPRYSSFHVYWKKFETGKPWAQQEEKFMELCSKAQIQGFLDAFDLLARWKVEFKNKISELFNLGPGVRLRQKTDFDCFIFEIDQ